MPASGFAPPTSRTRRLFSALVRFLGRVVFLHLSSSCSRRIRINASRRARGSPEAAGTTEESKRGIDEEALPHISQRPPAGPLLHKTRQNNPFRRRWKGG